MRIGSGIEASRDWQRAFVNELAQLSCVGAAKHNSRRIGHGGV